MASRTQLQPGNVYAIFGTETSRGVKEMGILVTAVAPDAKSLLLPCVPINVSAKSAKFQSAIQLNKVPQDACIDEINSDLTTYYCVRELSEKKWLEFYLNLLESKLEGLDSGKAHNQKRHTSKSEEPGNRSPQRSRPSTRTLEPIKPSFTQMHECKAAQSGEHFMQGLLRLCGVLLDKQRDALVRFQREHDVLERAFESGHAFPWVTLARLQAPKFLSDIVGSLLGAVYHDSNGDMGAGSGVLDLLGLLSVPWRAMRRGGRAASGVVCYEVNHQSFARQVRRH
ncbi:hypothetical protein DFH11DRAFT_1548134 [Phellopilus nigrolimitatus]|nr:hypothetical protein DFH11DRAFT_1548134 [Phellopilus nigrolimitatus]